MDNPLQKTQKGFDSPETTTISFQLHNPLFDPLEETFCIDHPRQANTESAIKPCKYMKQNPWKLTEFILFYYNSVKKCIMMSIFGKLHPWTTIQKMWCITKWCGLPNEDYTHLMSSTWWVNNEEKLVSYHSYSRPNHCFLGLWFKILRLTLIFMISFTIFQQIFKESWNHRAGLYTRLIFIFRGIQDPPKVADEMGTWSWFKTGMLYLTEAIKNRNILELGKISTDDCIN